MALDSGPISNPDGLRNQAEGGALHGVSRALFEEVTWDNEKVTSLDWRTYRAISCRLQSAETGDGAHQFHGRGSLRRAGETSNPVTAAAIGNAIFDATGVRLRQVPFTPERVKAAISTN